MLLQHIRTAEPSVEAAIAFNLVHLALVAPQDAFVDIVRAFCFINRTTRIGEDRQLNDMVIVPIRFKACWWLILVHRSWLRRQDLRKR
jgi:hypothetical protein